MASDAAASDEPLLIDHDSLLIYIKTMLNSTSYDCMALNKSKID